MDNEVVKKVIMKLRSERIPEDVIEDVGEVISEVMGAGPMEGEMMEGMEGVEEEKQTDLAPGMIEEVGVKEKAAPMDPNEIFNKDDMGKPGLKGKVAMRAKGMMK